MAGDVTGLLAEAYGKCFRLLCSVMNLDCEGLSLAARTAKRRQWISHEMYKKLKRLDVCRGQALKQCKIEVVR